jgi:hypothetical protein
MIDHCQCHELSYSSLPEAIGVLDQLAHSGA